MGLENRLDFPEATRPLLFCCCGIGLALQTSPRRPDSIVYTRSLMADGSASSSAPPSQLHKQRTLDKWIEPSLPEPVPSYKDRPNLNLPPYGVLTNMAPLGTLPNTKMQKIAKTDASKVPLKNGESSGSTPMEETTTPDPIPHPNTRRSLSHKEDDMDYRPPVTPTASTMGQVQQTVTNGTRPNLTNASRASSYTSYTPLSTRQSLSTPRPTSSSMFASTSMHRPAIRLEQVVLSAIRAARGAGRHHTAFALTDLITHHRDDPSVERVLRAVATAEDEIVPPSVMAELTPMVQQKKRESRRKGLPERRPSSSSFAAPNIRFATPSYNSPSKKATAASESLPEEPPSESRLSLKRPSSSPSKEFGHVNKKLKSNNFEPEKEADIADPSLEMNGSSMQQSLSDASRSSSPLSELDDIDELLLQAGNFAQSESTGEIRAGTAEIHARVRPASTRKSAASGPKLHTYIPNSSNMAVAASPSPSSSTFPSHNNSKSHRKNASALPQRLDPNDAREVLRRKARAVTNGEHISESDLRTPLTSLEVDSESEGADSSIATSRRPAPSGLRLRLRNIPKGPVNDESDKSSPTFLPFQHELASTSSTNSRQSTPNPYGRPTRKAKTGPRVKTSPMKNRAVPLAGISRASGERNSPVGNGGFGSTQDDNHDDYCSSCGGGGMIVCCDGDGCKRSYHWLCLDPPRREEDVDSTESIYCSSCTAAMRTETRRAPGLFASLLGNIERKNPVAFRLSKDIAEYFEGVKTGPQGEYEDILPANHKTKNRAGYEEAPDYLRLKDNKGNTIICHQCLRSAAGGQLIVPCSFCSLHWHLDCLDPPLANPPTRDRPWKCPCHVDDLLDKIPGMLGPAHKYRKIKGNAAMRPATARNIRNNGHIEIENSLSDDDEASGFYNQNVFGKEYRLPEHGVKLEFLTKVKRDNMRGSRKRKRGEESASTRPSASRPLSPRALDEQQAALNIVAVASRAVDFGAHDKVPSLVNALLAHASPDVVRLMAQADATNLERGNIQENERLSLAALTTWFTAFLKEAKVLQQTSVEEKTKEEPESSPTSLAAAVENQACERAAAAKSEHDDTNMLL